MRNILILFALIFCSCLSTRSDEIDYHVFEIYERNEYINKNEFKYDSLDYLDSELFSMLQSGSDLMSLYEFLKKSSTIFGIAVYTYKDSSHNLAESIWFQFSEKEKILSNLILHFSKPIVFPNDIYFNQLSEKYKVEHIIKVQSKDTNYYYNYQKSKGDNMRLGFPTPVPDAKDIDIKWGDFEDLAPKR